MQVQVQVCAGLCRFVQEKVSAPAGGGAPRQDGHEWLRTSSTAGPDAAGRSRRRPRGPGRHPRDHGEAQPARAKSARLRQARAGRIHGAAAEPPLRLPTEAEARDNPNLVIRLDLTPTPSAKVATGSTREAAPDILGIDTPVDLPDLPSAGMPANADGIDPTPTEETPTDLPPPGKGKTFALPQPAGGATSGDARRGAKGGNLPERLTADARSVLDLFRWAVDSYLRKPVPFFVLVAVLVLPASVLQSCLLAGVAHGPDASAFTGSAATVDFSARKAALAARIQASQAKGEIDKQAAAELAALTAVETTQVRAPEEKPGEGGWLREKLALLIQGLLLFGLAFPVACGALALATADQQGGAALPSIGDLWPILLARGELFLVSLIPAAVLVAVGNALFVLPGLVLSVLFVFVPHAVLFEKRGGRAALSRSIELVRSDAVRVTLAFLSFALLGFAAATLTELRAAHIREPGRGLPAFRRQRPTRDRRPACPGHGAGADLHRFALTNRGQPRTTFARGTGLAPGRDMVTLLRRAGSPSPLVHRGAGGSPAQGGSKEGRRVARPAGRDRARRGRREARPPDPPGGRGGRQGLCRAAGRGVPSGRKASAESRHADRARRRSRGPVPSRQSPRCAPRRWTFTIVECDGARTRRPGRTNPMWSSRCTRVDRPRTPSSSGRWHAGRGTCCSCHAAPRSTWRRPGWQRARRKPWGCHAMPRSGVGSSRPSWTPNARLRLEAAGYETTVSLLCRAHAYPAPPALARAPRWRTRSHGRRRARDCERFRGHLSGLRKPCDLAGAGGI